MQEFTQITWVIVGQHLVATNLEAAMVKHSVLGSSLHEQPEWSTVGTDYQQKMLTRNLSMHSRTPTTAYAATT